YGGGLGGAQNGYLLLRTGGQTRKIPISVSVQGGIGVGTIPPFIAPNQIPPQCQAELRNAQVQLTQNQEAGFDADGLPNDITVFVNPITGKGTYEREVKAPAGATSLKITQATNANVKIAYSANKLRITASCKTKDGSIDCQDATFKATWNLGNIQQTANDRTVHVIEDSFKPSALQFVVPKGSGDQAAFSVDSPGDFTKAKCSGASGITCAGNEIRGTLSAGVSGSLKIEGQGDYQIREIPVSAGAIEPKLSVSASGDEKTDVKEFTFEPALLLKPTCLKSKELASALEVVECTQKGVKLKGIPTGLDAGKNHAEGLLTFQFADAPRVGEKNPHVFVAVDKTDASAKELTIKVADSTIGQRYVISYSFPAGDAPDKRRISV
ncbi:MAG: hypothetical protein Q8P02_05625, partial [Candidatus Micrarchaeota archaeon]|nr:hypothetical protein [Candidatus Micrarchaeota archaeon]